ncbi:hypothetical protein SAMN04488116_2415 [Flagellimonas flava]|uniref:Uncharacterized protein n=1 Tax=Flagellimonas flava TaxID=570519 RepID=A0A1M5MEQ0_9FLAO|nr:hypothetical protein SAMN04488116_2415 [Allomuricauda flava]
MLKLLPLGREGGMTFYVRTEGRSDPFRHASVTPFPDRERSILVFQNKHQDVFLLNDLYGLSLLKTQFLQPTTFQPYFGYGGMVPSTATEFGMDLKFSGLFQSKIFA